MKISGGALFFAGVLLGIYSLTHPVTIVAVISILFLFFGSVLFLCGDVKISTSGQDLSPVGCGGQCYQCPFGGSGFNAYCSYFGGRL